MCGRSFKSSRHTLLSGSFFLCDVIITSFTEKNDSRISLRSFSDMKTKPFFEMSQLSLFKMTTKRSPNFFAAFKRRTWPMCTGSNPPDTATVFFFSFLAVLFLLICTYQTTTLAKKSRSFIHSNIPIFLRIIEYMHQLSLSRSSAASAYLRMFGQSSIRSMSSRVHHLHSSLLSP